MISFLITLIAAINFLNRVLMHTVMYRHCLHELCKNVWTSWDAVWYAESSGSREHVLHGE